MMWTTILFCRYGSILKTDDIAKKDIRRFLGLMTTATETISKATVMIANRVIGTIDKLN
jgi:hypothetical protein